VSAPLAALLAAAVLAAGAVIEASVPPELRTPLPSTDARLVRVAGAWRFEGRPYSGRMVEALPDGGRIERAIVDGWAQGEERTWYPDGALRAIRYYAHGAKVGVHRGWWPDGTPQFERRFAHGRPDGLARTWYANGQLFDEHRYVAGQEAGPQQLWFADGRVRASYEIRDGRRYGSIGSKPCASDAPAAAPGHA
jgi:hypothetical protein